MRILKALGIGVVVGVLTGIGWIFGSLLMQVLWQMWQQRGQGGALGAVSVGDGEALPAALIGFALAFVWMLRRSRRTALN